jgi:beta-phosphoglucomutase-like phosphatase (HAD superfamily)|tara:strand:+ start:143 stop:718 length:576 start_codon:yes stop_codon:yes gene_type:complete
VKNKVILVDCDGVLLDWMYSFQAWMKRHGYDAIDVDKYKIHEIFGIYKTEGKKLCRMFNESATIRKVPPHKDAIKYVKKLHEEEGYIFHAVTSLSNDEYAQHLRTKNLCELFGPTVFEKYVYLDTGADKDEALAVYKDTGCIWVEDKVENAQAGAAVGLESLVMKHAYNSDCTEFPLMNNWKEIYEYIKGK